MENNPAQDQQMDLADEVAATRKDPVKTGSNGTGISRFTTRTPTRSSLGFTISLSKWELGRL